MTAGVWGGRTKLVAGSCLWGGGPVISMLAIETCRAGPVKSTPGEDAYISLLFAEKPCREKGFLANSGLHPLCKQNPKKIFINK